MNEGLTESMLRGLAGARSFERGREYFELGRVEQVAFEGETALGIVQGSDRYRVRLRIRSDDPEVGPEAECNCPIGQEGAFCKHCVAVGLAILDAGDSLESRPPPMSVEELDRRLDGLERDELQALISSQLRIDDRLVERLRLHFAAPTEKGEPDVDAFRRAIDLACDPPGRVEPYEWYRGVEEALDAVERLISTGSASAAVELSEHAIGTVVGSRWRIDDSDGVTTTLLERLERMHATACERACPDPEALAERLLELWLDGEAEVFADAIETHAAPLGERGLARYRELAEARWEQVPALEPGAGRDWSSGRFAITAAMERLARASGDLDELVAVLARDLSTPYGFLKIAEACQAAGRQALAVEWAERGVDAFPDRPDPRLRSFLVDAYAAAGRGRDALEMAWERFADHPTLDNYRKLKPHAERLDEWPRRRERAHGLLRERARRAREESPLKGYGFKIPGADHSELVRILLWEEEADAAWREARAGGCDASLWLRLAELREEEHPEDSLLVYLERIEPTIDRKTKADYAEAVELIERAGAIFRRLDREPEFAELVAEIRSTHARKRNLIALLDAADLPAGRP